MHNRIPREERDSTPFSSGFAGANATAWHLPPRQERSVGTLILLQLTILTLIQPKAQKPSPGCVIADNQSACLERTGVIFIYLEKAWAENKHFQLLHCIRPLLPQLQVVGRRRRRRDVHPPREVQPNQAASEGLRRSNNSTWEVLCWTL